MFDPESSVPGVSFVVSFPVDCDNQDEQATQKDSVVHEPPLKVCDCDTKFEFWKKKWAGLPQWTLG